MGQVEEMGGQIKQIMTQSRDVLRRLANHSNDNMLTSQNHI